MEEKSKIFGIDEIINDIAFGKFHLKQYLVALFIILNYITHVVLSGYILPALIKSWHLSLFEQSFIGSLEFFMQIVASLLTSYSTPYGRKMPILITVIIWTFAVFALSIFDNFYLFCIFRGISSCASLMCNLISYTLLCEVLPIKSRGKLLGSFEFVVVLGNLQLILLMSFTFTNIDEGNIQLLFFYLFLIMVLISLFIMKFCEESPRFLCFQGKYEECFWLLDQIHQENTKSLQPYMTNERKESFFEWINEIKNEEAQIKNQEKITVRSLFKGGYRVITLTLFFVWIANGFVAAGNDYIFPLTMFKIFSEEKSSQNVITFMFYLNLANIPLLIPAVLALDMKKIGRKKTLLFSLNLLGIACFFLWLEEFLTNFVWLLLIKYGIAINFMVLCIYTNEIYPTHLRSLGFGSSTSIGKMASTIAPAISVYFSDLEMHFPYLIFSIISLLGGILLWNLRHDTTNESMEKILKNEEFELEQIK